MNPEIFRIGSFAVRWYGLLFVSGFILGYWIFARFFKREKVNEALLDPLLYTLMNSMRKRIPKQTMKNIPMNEPLYILSSLLT